MRLFGLGSTWPSQTPEVTECGPSPCTWWDNVYARDACLNYMACAIPNDPTTIALSQGLPAGVGAETGEVVGGVVGSAASGLGTGLTGGLNMPGAVLLGMIALGGILILTRR